MLFSLFARLALFSNIPALLPGISEIVEREPARPADIRQAGGPETLMTVKRERVKA
ncbi:MAG: hypothetical protein U1C46_12005 [Bacteroidales bacterium]|nr:hypothetical protein [Bacteroidales bacterium]